MLTAGRATADEALRLVQQQPQAALDMARWLLAAGVDEAETAKAHWAVGMAARELGDLADARHEIERAVSLAEPLGDDALVARMLVSLALVHAFDGRIEAAVDVLDRAEALAEGSELAHVEMQRGVVVYWQGRLEDSLAAYGRSLAMLREDPDDLLEARVRVNLGAALSWFGRLDAASEHLATAATLADRLGQTLIAATAAHNLAHVEALRGDLPAAFSAFHTAEDRFRSAGAGVQYLDLLHLDHARALLHANLLDDASRSVGSVVGNRGSTIAGDAHYVAAQVEMARGDPDAAFDAAMRSAALFGQAGRSSWAILATSLAHGARAIGAPDDRTTAEATKVADALAGMGYRIEAVRGLIVAARACVRRGDTAGAEALVERIRRRRHLTTALDRIVVAQIAAECARRRGRPAIARRHVRDGLRTFAENEAALGAIELRARAAANGEALAAQGMALAIEDGRASELLSYMEATRSTANAFHLVRPPSDPALAEMLADLRRTAHELRELAPGPARAQLERDRTIIERRIRDHTLGARGGPMSQTGVDVASLGEHVLLEYCELAGHLWAVTVIDHRSRIHDLGPTTGLRDDVESCAFALHRLNRAQGSPAARAAALGALRTVSDEIVARVMPPGIRESGRPVVIVPSGVLNGFAWNAAPSLAGVELTMAPSLAAWTSMRPPAFGSATHDVAATRAVLISGPELSGADREVAALATILPDVVALTGERATATASLELIDGARLAHYACHGAFRADNPLFSTLLLADGPLTVYDFERVGRMPTQVVLSACHAAASMALVGGALLGLANALLTFGTRSVVAPLTPVNDERVVWATTEIHRHLHAGVSAAGAVSRAIAAAPDDDAWAAIVPFLALGASS